MYGCVGVAFTRAFGYIFSRPLGLVFSGFVTWASLTSLTVTVAAFPEELVLIDLQSFEPIYG
jgi:hypothetical protein